VTASSTKPSWARLFRIACALIRQVNAPASVIDRWTFGGGTAMMLHIRHRESRDVDIFLPDPQFLSFLDPAKHDFEFEIQPTDYRGDGARFLKLAFKDIGEIDFIVAGGLTFEPVSQARVEGETVLLETPPEIITKKLYHRGTAIKPRDIFDIAAAGRAHHEMIVAELKRYKDKVANALAVMDRLNPEFVDAAISQLAIKPEYADIARTARQRAEELLRAV